MTEVLRRVQVLEMRTTAVWHMAGHATLTCN